LSKKEKYTYLPTNSTLNANIQPEKSANMNPQQIGLSLSAIGENTPKRKQRITCKFCGEESLSETQLKKHLQEKH
jgi:hypothetical protein